MTTFQTEHVYRGLAERQVVIAGDGSNCDVPFRQGEAWLVYGQLRGGRVTTHKCTRTRLRAEAEGAQDLAYLDGLQRGRRQGVVYGEVLRRVADADGKPTLQALSEPLRVIAAGPAGRFEVTTDRWGPYQLVVPPGSFELRVERGRGAATDLAPMHLEVWIDRVGGSSMATKPILVEAGAERRLALVVEYKN